jgi:hypothetical protein
MVAVRVGGVLGEPGGLSDALGQVNHQSLNTSDARALNCLARHRTRQVVVPAICEGGPRGRSRTGGPRCVPRVPAGPYAGQVRAIESIIRNSRSRQNWRDALDEHALLGLPTMAEIKTALREAGGPYRITPLTTVGEWLASFVFDETDGEDADLLVDYCNLLNTGATLDSGAGPIYRYLVTIDMTGASKSV